MANCDTTGRGRCTEMPPRLFLLYSRGCHNYAARLSMLQTAAQRLDLNVVELESSDVDYSDLDWFGSGPGDMFCNVTPASHELEKICIHRKMTGFFTEPSQTNFVFSSTQFDVSLLHAGIAVPRTVIRGTNNRVLLEKYVDYLLGFPLILKVHGGSRGVGVVKVESWEGLTSLADYMTAVQKEFTLKQFIPNEGTIRAVVVGDRLVGAVLRVNKPGEFRCSSPAEQPHMRIVEPTGQLTDLSLRAAQAVGHEFVGVDIVQDGSGAYSVLEVNYPHDFATPQEFSGIDFAFEAVRHLVRKSAMARDTTA